MVSVNWCRDCDEPECGKPQQECPHYSSLQEDRAKPMTKPAVPAVAPVLTGWAVVWPNGVLLFTNAAVPDTEEGAWFRIYCSLHLIVGFGRWRDRQIAAGATCQRYRLVPDTPRPTRTPEQRKAIARVRRDYDLQSCDYPLVVVERNTLRLVMEALGDE